SVALTTTSACPWTASSSASWLTVTSVTSGTGSATVSYAVAANTGTARSANLTIGGRTFLVSQAAVTITQAPATAALSPATLDFGSVMVGKSLAKTATLTNAGGGTLTISSLSPAGTNASEFSIGGTCAANTALSAGQSCSISITFRPAGIGARLASIAINTSSNATTLMLSGTGKKSGRK
ncbi:MAG: choice-of-anchor D domain-containing protein, partial [Betaproteobacteria bacterium]